MQRFKRITARQVNKLKQKKKKKTQSKSASFILFVASHFLTENVETMNKMFSVIMSDFSCSGILTS